MFSLKSMSDLKLTIITKVKNDFILSKLPPIIDAPITSFIKTVDEVDNEYNKFIPHGS